MNIQVEYKDAKGTINKRTRRITCLAFVKHLAIAGQGYAPRPQKLLRTLAMFLHYSSYIQLQAFNNDRFSEPPIQLSDPTEKAHFSNLAGKAIADFLSKRINQSLYTVNYEAAMRLKGLPINVGRPDLLAFSQKAIFAIEVKGYSRGYKNMATHKKQSEEGGIPVNFSVACVSYDLYNKVKCKYYDPFIDNIPYDKELLRLLTKEYYSGLSEFLNEEYFIKSETKIQGEKFYEVQLSYRPFEKLFTNDFLFRHCRFCKIIEYYRPRIILPYSISDYATKGITNDIKPFIFEKSEQESNTYIDNDRIGLRIKQ